MNDTQLQEIMTTGTENIRDLKGGSGLMPHPNVCRLATGNVSIDNQKPCRLATSDVSIDDRTMNNTQLQVIITTGTENIRDLKGGGGLMPHPNVCRLATGNVSIDNQKPCRLTTFEKKTSYNSELDLIICFVAAVRWVILPRYHKVVISKRPESVSIDNQNVSIDNQNVSIDNQNVSIDNQNVSIDNQNQRIAPFKQLDTSHPVFFHLFYLFHLFQGGLSAQPIFL